MLTVGGDHYTTAAISMHTNPSDAVSSSGYGKIYVNDQIERDVNDLYVQTHTLKFIDGSGNKFDLVEPANECDKNGKATFYKYGNLAVGPQAIERRCTIDGHTYGNVVFGPASLSGVNSGEYNVVFGWHNAPQIVNGSKNVIMGYHNLRDSSSDIGSGIMIGCSLGSGLTSSHKLLIGHTNPIISGDMSTNDVALPLGGLTVGGGNVNIESSNKLILKHTDGRDELRISTDKITVYDSGVEFPNQDLTFDFVGSGNTSNELLNLDHTASGMTNTPSYESPNPARPFAELKGDLKLQGAIRFSDGYSLEGSGIAADIEYVSGVAVNNFATLNGAFVEGFASGDIPVASNYNSPSSGYLLNYNDSSTFYTIYNRDKYTKIKENDYVIAIKVNGELRPIWVSNENSVCNCCVK